MILVKISNLICNLIFNYFIVNTLLNDINCPFLFTTMLYVRVAKKKKLYVRVFIEKSIWHDAQDEFFTPNLISL